MKSGALHRRIFIGKYRIPVLCFLLPKLRILKSRIRKLVKKRLLTGIRPGNLLPMLIELDNAFLLLIFLQNSHREVSVGIAESILADSHLSVRINGTVFNDKYGFGLRRFHKLIAVLPLPACVLNLLLRAV